MVIIPAEAFFFAGLITPPPPPLLLVVLTTVLGLEDRCIGLPMLPMADDVASLEEVEVVFLAMMRGFFFFLGFMPIITLPLLDILSYCC